MSKFDTEKDGRLVELYQDHREKLECIGTRVVQSRIMQYSRIILE